ncbi:MAG: ATP-binding protein [Acholeplasmatales bacterium]|nr:ATP-binding protein [Acholeplasmatales bacterium]
MRKVDFNYDNSLLSDYINEIQAYFKEYKIDLTNVNDFSIMKNEMENCSCCNGIDFCKNESKGYCTKYLDNQFILMECKYKKELRLQNEASNLIKTLYLPTSILEADLKDFHINSESRSKIYNQIIAFINSFGKQKCKGLYIYGSFSIGKTYTLACIANELSKNNISSLLIYFPDLVVDLKNAINTDRFEALINMLKSIDVLMLDDLGSENMTPWIRDEILGPILNYRALENKPVFISSNINPGDLKNHFSIDKASASSLKAERLLSRMNALMNSINMDDSQRYER